MRKDVVALMNHNIKFKNANDRGVSQIDIKLL